MWIGARLPALHPRAVMTALPPVRGRVLRFESIPRDAWRARSPKLDRVQRASLASTARRLRRAVARFDAAGGFGALLVRETPQFPLDRATPLVRALGRAFEDDDPDAVLAAALPLLGLGAGLTPSGDDLAGGAIFGRRLASGADARWTSVGRRLSREIRSRSHVVSAALFADLAAGRSFAPLHELATALAAADDEAAVRAARSLVSIGHSSGWDMLAGLLIGIGKTGGRRASK